MPVNLQIDGLFELSRRMQKFPDEWQYVTNTTAEASLMVIWEMAGKAYYPPAPPNSRYRRTGTLGRTLGVSYRSNRRLGKRADIYEVGHQRGQITMTFGTRLEYAPYVIGDRQSRANAKHWKKLDPGVRDMAYPKILKIWEAMARQVAKWLDSK